MILSIHVKPKAHETKFVSWLDDHTAVIAIHATPSDGEANLELIKFLSAKLNVPKTFILLKSGHTSRVKKVELPEGTSLSGLSSQ
ncbi:MAG: DUF167 domain-containing protein [Patescibacteria group bacterium]|jgi:hypothetical protein